MEGARFTTEPHPDLVDSISPNDMTNRFSLAALIGLCMLTACTPAAEKTQNPTPLTAVSTPQSTPVPQNDPFSHLPAAARQAAGFGDPRPAAYWLLWNSCAEDNRADLAAANGGRAAGFVLMDDLLADPGIALGDSLVEDCLTGLALLEGHPTDGGTEGGPIYALASALLAAELNLNVGAETCPAAEESAVGAHLVLSSTGFSGSGVYDLPAETADAIPELIELLNGYNSGALCR